MIQEPTIDNAHRVERNRPAAGRAFDVETADVALSSARERVAQRRQWAIVALFVGIVMSQLALGVVTVDVLSAVRAYVHGESLWSKGQKDAWFYSTRYVRTRAEEDYRAFHSALAAPLADRRARQGLDRPEPDLVLVAGAFVAGGSHPDDVPGMIRLYRGFHRVPFMADAIGIWARGDDRIAELASLVDLAHERIAAGDFDAPAARALSTRLPALNAELTSLERQFSARLGIASRKTQGLLLAVNLSLAAIMTLAGLRFARRTLNEQATAYRALRDSEERLQRALEASRLALWDFDLTSGHIYLSDAWSEMLGGPRAPTTTTFDALTRMVPDEDQPRIAESMGDALRGVTSCYSVEHRVVKADGQILWILSQGRVVDRGPDGQVRRAVGTNRDITERKQADAIQRELESQLREAQRLEAIGTLAGGIAHDFNNILAAILGNVALAQQDIGESHRALSYLAQINKAGQRARNLVKQILAFSRKQPSELAAYSLGPLVEETGGMLRSLLGGSVELHLTVPDHPLRVMADATQLQQVLMNLGTNAWHALAGAAGRIEIGLDDIEFTEMNAPRPAGLSPGPHARLWVRDNGCGMSDETRQRIFEPFFTTKPVGEGTGLGLAVARGIVETHGGAITVTTAPGKGSTFELFLPLVDEASAPMPLESTRAQPPRGSGQHVLYVDDDEMMALLVQSLLQRLGYRATCTLDAREALAIVARDPQSIDLVVTDFNMPKCSGLDVARAVSRLRPNLPVAISSGYISDELRANAQELGVRAVMEKEHTFENLGSLVHAALATDEATRPG